MTARFETPDPGGTLRFDPLHVLEVRERDRRIRGVAFAVAVVIHALALAVNLPELRRAPPGEPVVRRMPLVRRYVPPPPPSARATLERKKVKRMVPVPDPTPEEPEPVLDPVREVRASAPDASEFGVLLGAAEPPPGYRGGTGVEGDRDAGEPRLAGVAGVTNPVLIPESYVRPAYPEVARLARRQADVILRAIVTREGRVDEVEVLRCTAPAFGFEDAAIAAVRQWRYRPATQDGDPVAVYFTILVEFELL